MIATSSIWHARLGHPSSKIIQLLKSQFSLPIKGSINHDVICESCQLAKGKCLPFSVSSRVSKCPLELIHSDVWCSPISSLSGCRYYVIFIDNFSRFSWMFPLYHKSDTFNAFVKFKCYVENQLSTKIKALQSEGGGEFISNQFKHFLTKNGILHRISCPHTQQNGRAERKQTFG